MSDRGIIKIGEYKPHPYIGLASNKKEAFEAQKYYIDQETSRIKSVLNNFAYQYIGLDRSILSIISHTANLYLIWDIDIRHGVFSYVADLIKNHKIIIPDKFVILDLSNDDIKYLWTTDLVTGNTKGTLPLFINYSYLNNNRETYKRIEEYLPKGVVKTLKHPDISKVFEFLNEINTQKIQENVFLNALGVGLDL